jgi:chemotaxis methyl-accepting protein methylase
MKCIRDGLEDYEYLWMLADLGGDAELARRACERVTTDLTHFTRDPAVVAQVRDRVAMRIATALASR